MNIPYIHDQKLVRGLDYYNRTVFEVISTDLGAQDALCGGGRYDNLIEQLGGDKMPAMGFAAGMERLMIAMKLNHEKTNYTDIYIINLEEQLIEHSMKLSDDIRKDLGVAVYTDSLRRSLKSQMRHANKMNAKFVIILDSETIKNKTAMIKNMKTKKQEPILFNKIISYFESE